MPPQDIQSTLKDPKFLALSPDDQVAVLKKMREQGTTAAPAKPANLMAPQKSSLTEPNSIAGGFVRRGISAVKGLAETFDPRTKGTAEEVAVLGGPGVLAAERIGRGAFEAGKQKVGQTIQDVQNRDYGKAGLHLLEADPTSLIGPLSPAQSQAEMIEQGRYREAIGSGLFDALSTFAGERLTKAPSPRQAANKLRLATDLPVNDIKEVLPDIQKTTATGGKPATVGELQSAVRDTTDRLTAEFDRDFSAIKNNRIYTPFIRTRLEKILADNPQWLKTEDGLAKRTAIQDAIKEYDKTGWTFEEMNKERGDLRTSIRNLQKMAPADKRAALRNNADIAAKEAVADVMAETVNDWTAHASGKPKTYYDALRRKQATLIDMEKWLDDRIEKLADKQAEHEGLGPGGRFKFHATGVGTPQHGVIRGYVSGVNQALSQGPEAIANARVRQAFRSSKHPIIGSAVMSLPAATINQTHGTANPPRRSSITPPPQPAE